MSLDIVDAVPLAFTQLHKHEYIVTSPTLRGEVYSGPPETLEARTAVGALSKLVHAADRAKDRSELAISWRDYKVGASAVMCNFETGRMGFLDGYNVKPETGASSLNLHAEQVAIAKGRLQGLNRVVGISVFADPNDDDANPNGYATLRPCNRCVKMFIDIPEVTKETLVLGANTDLSICELYTVANLIDTDSPRLVEEQFALQTDNDLLYYDRVIQPSVIMPIMELFSE